MTHLDDDGGERSPLIAAENALRESPKVWLITGVAGFIGSNLLEALLKLGQRVVGLDNFATGHQRNLDEVRDLLGSKLWANFSFIEGDICNLDDCRRALTYPVRAGDDDAVVAVSYVLHQAALGSVPRSISDPIATNAANISGFLNMLTAARDANVARFVYAASSSTYGDHPDLPKIENRIGKPLSPYAVTKYVNELYAEVFFRTYGLESVGLRYFNVFGPRQDPDGAYAAVIPKWMSSLAHAQTVFINGDGETSRDFCYVDNAVQANILAATTTNSSAVNQIYNVAVGERTTLNQLFSYLKRGLAASFPHAVSAAPVFRGVRSGDIQHSLASVDKAKLLIGYTAPVSLEDGLSRLLRWYLPRIN